ncbi:MAG: hypothetical protein GQ535_12330 [Rhodobacteraceae bacterium]|nr:hypothetical protein [Paracoccaceae bacterium]
MALIIWLKSSKLARWLGMVFAALGFLKLIEGMGARRGKAELKAEQAVERLKETQLAKQDYDDAKSQTDASLIDRLTRDK